VAEITERQLIEDGIGTNDDGIGSDGPSSPWVYWVHTELLRQVPNAILWWPVCIAAGIGFFFSLPQDPWTWVAIVVLAVAVPSYLVARKRDRFFASTVALAISLFAVGFVSAQIRTHMVAAPILNDEIGPEILIGTAIQVEAIETSWRVTLDRLEIPSLGLSETPDRIRVRLPGSHGIPRVGDKIEVRAIVRPPGRPVAPGAFDFQRYSFFKKLGGVGFSVGRWQAIEADNSERMTLLDNIKAMRARVADRIATALPNESGAIARALVTGERNAVPETLQEAYREAGLAHMLAISGLHMSLIAGLAFIVLRFILAVFMPISERFDIKKIAAVAALCAAFFYLLLSGGNVPAQRAFIMISVVFIAVLIDRTALSLRTLACAAIAVFLYCFAVLVTDLIATGATAPFTAFHFHNVPSYSLLANLLAGPVMGLWVMPCGLAALILMPLGLEHVALIPMGVGIDAVDAIARFVAGLPGATFETPSANIWALVLVAFGGLLICLLRGPTRWLGIPILCIGLIQPWLAHSPDILVNETADLFAVKGNDERLIMSPGRRDGFTRRVWSENWSVSSDSWDSTATLECDLEGCVYQTANGTAALSYTDAAVFEDCGRADVMIARVPAWRLCKVGLRVDRFDVWRHGAHAVWLTDEGPIIDRVSDHTGKRIWNKPTWR
jgi:competence protein ComEC